MHLYVSYLCNLVSYPTGLKLGIAYFRFLVEFEKVNSSVVDK